MMTLEEWSTCDGAWYVLDVDSMFPIRFAPGTFDPVNERRRDASTNRWWYHSTGRWWFKSRGEARFYTEVLR